MGGIIAKLMKRSACDEVCEWFEYFINYPKEELESNAETRNKLLESGFEKTIRGKKELEDLISDRIEWLPEITKYMTHDEVLAILKSKKSDYFLKLDQPIHALMCKNKRLIEIEVKIKIAKIVYDNYKHELHQICIEHVSLCKKEVSAGPHWLSFLPD